MTALGRTHFAWSGGASNPAKSDTPQAGFAQSRRGSHLGMLASGLEMKDMDTSEALRILQALADGVDPHSGEVSPDESPYQHPQVVRALFRAIEVLKRVEVTERRQQDLPEKAGQVWDAEEEERLCEGFNQGLTIRELAQQQQRTEGAIQSRLEKLGKLAPRSSQ